jgi:hypothetical protein
MSIQPHGFSTLSPYPKWSPLELNCGCDSIVVYCGVIVSVPIVVYCGVIVSVPIVVYCGVIVSVPIVVYCGVIVSDPIVVYCGEHRNVMTRLCASESEPLHMSHQSHEWSAKVCIWHSCRGVAQSLKCCTVILNLDRFCFVLLFR